MNASCSAEDFQTPRSFVLTKLVCVIVLAVLVGTWASRLNSHATEKHGDLAKTTANCLDCEGKIVGSFMNPLTHRIVEVC